MSKVNIIWMPEPECPEAFWDRLGAVKSEAEGLELLCEAHEAGWITIFGQTKRSLRDIAAVLQEFYKVQVIENGNDDRRDDHG